MTRVDASEFGPHKEVQLVLQGTFKDVDLWHLNRPPLIKKVKQDIS
jgi:hypothetical protein